MDLPAMNLVNAAIEIFETAGVCLHAAPWMKSNELRKNGALLPHPCVGGSGSAVRTYSHKP